MLPFRFYLITDDANARHPAVQWLPRLVDAGLRAVQVRERHLAPAALRAHLQLLLTALGDRRERVRIYLNHEVALAAQLGLDGAHLREESPRLEALQAPLQEKLSFGVSTHAVAGAQAAEAAGADFVTFGPVFATPSKAAYGAPVGLAALARAAGATRLPVLALGGITPGRVADCLAAGAHGVAAISAVWDAPDPVAALHAFEEALGGL